VIRALGRVGFVVIRTKGSHHVMKHSDGRTTVVPVHAGEVIGPGLLREIIKQSEITQEQFEQLL
jgi:predicted RNA binding protein YcfA (HicA-like mRNA interferase family)